MMDSISKGNKIKYDSKNKFNTSKLDKRQRDQ